MKYRQVVEVKLQRQTTKSRVDCFWTATIIATWMRLLMCNQNELIFYQDIQKRNYSAFFFFWLNGKKIRSKNLKNDRKEK